MRHDDPRTERARLHTLSACLAALLLPCGVRAGNGHRQIGWNELVPPGWDAHQGLRDLPADLDDLKDTDPRAKAMLDKLRQTWDQAPVVAGLAGSDVKLPGYMVPLKVGKAGVSKFLLVPFFGSCVHSPPPPANQIVLCRSARPLAGLRLMEAIWAEGRMELQRNPTSLGVAGYAMRLASAQKQL